MKFKYKLLSLLMLLNIQSSNAIFYLSCLRQKTSNALNGTYQLVNATYNNASINLQRAYNWTRNAPTQISTYIDQKIDNVKGKTIQEIQNDIDFITTELENINNLIPKLQESCQEFKNNKNKLFQMPLDEGKNAICIYMSSILQGKISQENLKYLFDIYENDNDSLNYETEKKHYDSLILILSNKLTTKTSELKALKNSLQFKKQIGNEIYKHSSPYLKKAIKYFILSTIVVAISYGILPQSINSYITSAYLKTLALPFYLAWWGIKLPFNYIQLMWQNSALQNEFQPIICINNCLNNYGIDFTKHPNLLQSATNECNLQCIEK
ncbi:hypothetical protein GF322_00020 [Candidatus Dependentiae bacterium]|nr:hypothetical protein [Candidatus Dependentiae bacterium]